MLPAGTAPDALPVLGTVTIRPQAAAAIDIVSTAKPARRISFSSPTALAAVVSAFCAFALHLAFPRTGAWWLIPFALAVMFRDVGGAAAAGRRRQRLPERARLLHALVLVVRRNGRGTGWSGRLHDRPRTGARRSIGVRVYRAGRIAGRAPLRAGARAAGDGGGIHGRRMDALLRNRRRAVRPARAAAGR